MSQSKYQFAREMLFTLRSTDAISSDVYLHWLNEIDREEQETIFIAIPDQFANIEVKLEAKDNLITEAVGEVVLIAQCNDMDKAIQLIRDQYIVIARHDLNDY